MLLGKRPRPPMRRTTSMTEFAADFLAGGDVEAPRSSQQQQGHRQRPHGESADGVGRRYGGEGAEARNAAAAVSALVSPRHWKNSGDYTRVETAPFLKACGLCKRRLGPGRDTYMYRGDIAFCSLECRQQQMNKDEHTEKCSPPAATSSEQSGSSVAAA